MAKNKITTSQGNVQFTNAKGRTINMHPMHCYAVYEGDTVSFLFIYMKEYSGQAFFASQFEDLEVDGETYDSIDALKEAIAEAFAKAGAQARTEIVDELPETGYTNTIYLVKKEHGEGYDEYIYNEEKGWQLIGDTDIEFERYLQKVDFNAYSADTKEKIDFISGAVDDNASDIQFISGAVDTEITNREAADAVISGAVDTLSTNLSNEVQRAISAETQLQNNINTVNGRVDAEQIARAQADTALSGAIDTVVSNLANEVSARTAADEALDSKIDTVSGDVISETSRAEGAEIALGGRIDNEITARTSADTALQTAINNEASARTDADSALSGAIDSVDSKVDTLSGEVQTMGDEAIVDAAYVSSSTTIDFYNASGNVVAQVDATDFIKDGMIEDVRIENGYLIIDFNTESGIQDISIPLTDIFNPDNYYDKDAIDGIVSGLNESIDEKFDASGITAYSTSQEVTAEIEAATSGKAENSDLVALSGEVATLSGNAITSGDVQNQIDAAVSGKQDTLIAGENITISGNVISSSGGGVDSGAVESIIEDYMTTDVFELGVEYRWNINNRLGDLSIIGNNNYGWVNASMMEPEVNIVPRYVSNVDGSFGFGTSYISSEIASKLNIQSGSAYGGCFVLLIKSEYADTIPSEYKNDNNKCWIKLNQPITSETLTNDVVDGGIYIDAGQIESGIVGWSEVSGNTYHALMLADYNTIHKFNFNRFSMGQQAAISLTGKFDEIPGYMTAYGQYIGWTIVTDKNWQQTSILTPLKSSDTVNSFTSTTGKTIFNVAKEKTYTATDLTELSEKQDKLNAGQNISISTNNNTISCTLNATNGQGSGSIKFGNLGSAIGSQSVSEGGRAIGWSSHAEGADTQANGDCSHAEGKYTVANNDSEHASGRYNISSSASTTFGDSGNTLFSVGNGLDIGRHNAFEIRQNGDIYVPNTDDTSITGDYPYASYPMVRLQDTITALGGLKLVKLTQSEYDSLATKDSNTLYIISD